jgi:hypothetical protein
LRPTQLRANAQEASEIGATVSREPRQRQGTSRAWLRSQQSHTQERQHSNATKRWQ